MLINTILFLNWIILFYFILLSLGYLALLFCSIPEIYSEFNQSKIYKPLNLLKAYTLPPVSILVPFYNEEKNILNAIQSVIKSDYPNVQLILINDGSTDTSLKRVIEHFQMRTIPPLLKDKIKTYGKVINFYASLSHENLILIDKEHSDKSDSLNVGINANRCPLFLTIDADSIIEPDAISEIMFHLLKNSYPVAVGGGVYVLNGCEYHDGVITNPRMSSKPIEIFQSCEYLRSFLFSRAGWNLFGGALCYAGTFTLINNHSAMSVGGYDINNLAQDFEMTTHLHEYHRENKFGYHIGYTPSAIVWTTVPSTLKTYWKQRFNWQYYSLKSLMLHKKMLFNPSYGIVGLFTYPFYLFGEILGGVVEFLAYTLVIFALCLDIFDIKWTTMFFVLAFGFSTFLTMATALLSFITFNKYRKLNDIFRIFVFSILENFGFRQYNVLCRVAATIKYFWDALKKPTKTDSANS